MNHALIDGDILCYRIGFAYNEEDEVFAISKLDEAIHQIASGAEAKTFEIFLSDESNFRKDVAVTLPYKGNRTAPRPKHYHSLRKFMLEQYGAVLSINEEADDVLGYSQTKDTIICSLDKDLLMIPGWHYNFVKGEKKFIDECSAFYNFCFQMLVGDSTDNIAGLDRIGKVKAARILENLSTKQDMWCAVCFWYAVKEDEPEQRLLENGKLLWIRRKPNQEWSLDNNDCF